ncbi:hypothetical protein EKH77_26565 [Streptomyces luteoverticillatus]|uniref:Uncharacterized protein n=1 Tax=Streptomyces luteoverticillatus TaxID=66425 RepID=A0A3Q9G009_STRLT|nr:hypothetical protein EKH77_26565 [Streptomyces luteoverticillatus]
MRPDVPSSACDQPRHDGTLFQPSDGKRFVRPWEPPGRPGRPCRGRFPGPRPGRERPGARAVNSAFR